MFNVGFWPRDESCNLISERSLILPSPSVTQTYSLGLVDLKSGKHSGRNSTPTPAWCGARFLVNGGKTKNKHSRVLSTWNGAPDYEKGRYLMIPYGKLGWGVGGGLHSIISSISRGPTCDFKPAAEPTWWSKQRDRNNDRFKDSSCVWMFQVTLFFFFFGTTWLLVIFPLTS